MSHELSPETAAADPAFWERLMPALHASLFLPTREAREARRERRLALFGTTPERVDVMQEWLHGPNYEKHPEKAPAEVLARARARLERLAPESPAAARYELGRLLDGMMARRTPPPVRVFSVEYGEHTIRIHLDPQAGPVYELHHPSRSEPLELGFPDGHARAPALRWQEVEVLAAGQARWVRLLLSRATWLSRDDAPADFRAFLGRAFAETGCFPERRSEELAAAYVPEGAKLDDLTVTWREDPSLGFVNDGVYSPRNPENTYWRKEDFSTFRAFLESLRST